MDSDDVSYLSPSFNLNSLTIPRLRSILVSHDVPYPASAKKSQLIEILRSQVLPNAARILRQREQIRRTSSGILNARSNQDLLDEERGGAAAYGGSDDREDHQRAVPATPATGGRRKRTTGAAGTRASTRASTAERSGLGSFDGDLDPPLSFSTRKRRSTRQSTFDSDIGDAAAATAQTPYKASATPARRASKATATPTVRSTRRSKSRQSDVLSSSINDNDESTLVASLTPATARPATSRSTRAVSSSSFAGPDESNMTTPTARQSPAPSRTPTLTGHPMAASKTPRRSASVFSNNNPFQSGTPRLEPTTYAQAPATAPSKRPPAKLIYYTGSASVTPRRRSVTPQIKEEPRTSATPESLLAAASSSRWGRSRYDEPNIRESHQEQGEEEEEEEEVSEATNSEEEEEDEEETEEEETTEEESEEDVAEDTFQVREMSREISNTGDDNEEFNPEIPVQRSSAPSRSPSPDFGEEFTPEEQLSLEEEQAANGKWDAVDHVYNKHRRQRAPPSATGKLVRFLSWILILSIFSTIGLWYRQEKIEIGYCGFGKAEWSLRQYPDVPEWIHSYLEPVCEPCPQHAYCYPSYEMRCEPSFIRVRHPFSVFGLLPLPVTCEPDSEKARRVNSVVQKALEILREQRAKFECREKGRGGGVVIRPEMTVSELKEVISQLRRKGMTDEEFEDLWRGAIPEIRGKDEVISSVKGPHHHRKTSSKNDDRPEQGRAIATGELTLTSTSLSRLSLACSLRRSFRLTLLAYRLPLLLLSAAAFTAMYIRYRVLRRRAERAEVPLLVNFTLDRLATQAALHARKAATEPWISITQLRDDVMRDEGRKKRERVWKLVGAVVEQNSNVRAGVREGRAGDVSRCWEWIGGIGGAAGVGDWWSEGVKTKNEENEKRKGPTSPLKDSTNGREDEVEQKNKEEEKKKPVPKKYENSRPIF